MPDIPAGTPIEIPDDLVTLAEAARLTQRPLRLIQAWTNPGPNGEPPILPVARQDPDGVKRKWVRLVDLRATTSRRHWGTKHRKRKPLVTESGRLIDIPSQEPTDSRLPEEGKERTPTS